MDKNEQLHSDLIKSWNQRYLITQANLEKKITKYLVDINVQYRPNLKDKYCGKFVSCGEYPGHINLLNDLTIINKNQSVILKHNGELVGAVIRDIASKEVFHHFGIKMKLTIDAHYPIKRGKEHVGLGTIVGQGDRKNPLDSKIGKYAYKEKVVNHEAQRIIEDDGDTLAEWLYNNAKYHLPWAIVSYEQFREKCNLDKESMVGAIFCAKNYEAIGHIDNDRLEWAIGFVYDEGEVNEGYFFYPEFGVAIEMTSNSIWCWKTKAVHSTTKLKLSTNSNRYTCALTLTEKTARTIERMQNS